MRNKRFILLPILMTLIVLTAGFIINSFIAISTTSSYITIVEKGHSEDHNEEWIKAFNPHAPVAFREEIKILVKEPMAWNLIEKDKTYLVNYSKQSNGLLVLKSIENIEDYG